MKDSQRLEKAKEAMGKVVAAARKSVEPKQRKSRKGKGFFLSLEHHPAIEAWIMRSAQEEFRTPEAQVCFILNEVHQKNTKGGENEKVSS